jgi:hypothetical protein
MKFLSLGVLIIGSLVAALPYAQGEADKAWGDLIDSDIGKFSVSVQPAQKKVEVKKVAGDQKSPPYLRVRVLRPNDRPLELKLKTIERVNSPLSYTGRADSWGDSYTGLEVDFSFDQKTWKRLGKAIRKIIP